MVSFVVGYDVGAFRLGDTRTEWHDVYLEARVGRRRSKAAHLATLLAPRGQARLKPANATRFVRRGKTTSTAPLLQLKTNHLWKKAVRDKPIHMISDDSNVGALDNSSPHCCGGTRGHHSRSYTLSSHRGARTQPSDDTASYTARARPGVCPELPGLKANVRDLTPLR